MVGVITNYKDWIFTRYDMKAEINKQKGRFDSKNNSANSKERRNEFEYSETFQIFKIDPKSKEMVFDYK